MQMLKNQSREQRIGWLTGLFGITGFALSSFCFFLNAAFIPLGFLLGTSVSLLNFILLCYQVRLLTQEKPVPVARFLYVIRFLLYGIALSLGFILERFGLRLFAWYTVFAGILLSKVAIHLEQRFFKEDL